MIRVEHPELRHALLSSTSVCMTRPAMFLTHIRHIPDKYETKVRFYRGDERHDSNLGPDGLVLEEEIYSAVCYSVASSFGVRMPMWAMPRAAPISITSATGWKLRVGSPLTKRTFSAREE